MFEEERGDSDGSCLGVSLVEPNEALSGFAMRRPPSDWVRFMLLAMVGLLNECDDSGVMS